MKPGNWHVSDEPSLLDNRYICFQIDKLHVCLGGRGERKIVTIQLLTVQNGCHMRRHQVLLGGRNSDVCTQCMLAHEQAREVNISYDSTIIHS